MLTVRNFLSMWVDDIYIKVYHMPGKSEPDTAIVLKGAGTVDFLLNRNADYLDYIIQNLQMDKGVVTVVCREQEEHINLNEQIISTAIDEDLLRLHFTENNWDHIILHFADGTNLGITAYSMAPDNMRNEQTIEYYEVSFAGTWQGANTLSQVAEICNQHTEIADKHNEDKNKLHQYFLDHIANEEFSQDEWDYYSDWHKDVFGHRPHGITFGY